MGQGQGGDEDGQTGVVGDRLLDERDEGVQRPPPQVHHDDLGAVDDEGVGLAAVGADLEGLGGQLLRLVGVPGDQGPGGALEGVHPVQEGLVELLDQGPLDLEAAVHLGDVPGARGHEPPPARRTCTAAPGHRPARRTGQGVSGPGEGQLEQVGNGERELDMVEDPHDDEHRRRSSRRWPAPPLPTTCRRPSGLPMVSSEHSVDRTSARSGWSAGQPVERRLQYLDLLGVDGAHGAEGPAVVGQGGRHQAVGVAEVGRLPACLQQRVAEGGITRLAFGGAEPDEQIELEDGIGVTRSGRRGRGPGRSSGGRRPAPGR